MLVAIDDNFFYMTYKKNEIFFLVATNRLWAVTPSLNFLNLFYLFCSEQSGRSFIVGLNNGLATMPMNIIIE